MMNNMVTWDEILRHCADSRDVDGFCKISCSCSGAGYSCNARDFVGCPDGAKPVSGLCGFIGFVKE